MDAFRGRHADHRTPLHEEPMLTDLIDDLSHRQDWLTRATRGQRLPQLLQACRVPTAFIGMKI
ncbi:hypothetical protein [Streptomyces flaveolus]|uniref:hypothetical protein n=1 Tax=Streptomyces flaveolus TaxID=67297 RepID=UPI001670BF22|nr:hypothetical protein [Streptomyces flaveolus]GGQ45977.1 hypothetical protein GCM10010216_02610 [Streptomyces flaveolus]